LGAIIRAVEKIAGSTVDLAFGAQALAVGTNADPTAIFGTVF
jgi:hypothetical protein